MANATRKPGLRPANPAFSSGPCAKRPGWSLAALEPALLGRSHRAKDPKARLAEVIDRSKAVLGMPADWRLGIVPASDTGAVEMALWSMLGARGVDILAWEILLEGMGDGCRQAAEAEGCARAGSALWPAAGSRAGRRSTATSSSCGTARPPACGCRMPTSSPPIARGWPSATRPRRPSRWTCPGTSSMWSPGPGRRCWAARPAHGMLALSPRAVARLESPHARLADAEDLPHDQGRQADRGHLQGRDDQHARPCSASRMRSTGCAGPRASAG